MTTRSEYTTQRNLATELSITTLQGLEELRQQQLAILPSYQDEIKESLNQGNPLHLRVRSDIGHGDCFMMAWAMKQALTVYAQKNGIPITSLEIDLDYEYGRSQVARLLGGPFETVHLDLEFSSILEERLCLAFTALGMKVEDIPSSLLTQRPEPFPIEDGKVFDGIKLDQAKERGKEYKEQLGQREVILITQSGSSPVKRFSSEQINALIRTVKKENPHAAIVVLTDGELDYYSNSSESSYPEADRVVAISSLQQLTEWCYAADRLITTDTFWAWWAGGIIDSVDVLHTVANEYWGNPGVRPTYSSILEKVAEKDDLTDTQRIAYQRLGMISSEFYAELWGMESMDEGIHPDDFLKFQENVERFH